MSDFVVRFRYFVTENAENEGRHDTQHYDTQHNDIQHNGLICDIQHKRHRA